MLRNVIAAIGSRGRVRVVFEVMLVVQLLHLGEHLAQMIQLYALGWPPPVARGIVSNLDVEKVHFFWNLGVLATLVWLVSRGVRSPWLLATLTWAVLHTSEHAFLLTNALLNGVEGQPGILGAGGWLARHGWDVPGLTTWSRATVHFAWNTVEVALLALTYATFAGWRWRQLSDGREAMGVIRRSLRGPAPVLLLVMLALLVNPEPASEQSGPTRYVNHADPTCGGHSPCYQTIQAAVNAVLPGETILIQAGTYAEQVSIQGKNNVASAAEADRIFVMADPAAPLGSVVITGGASGCTNGHAIRLQQSKFITLRGLTITSAGGQAIALLGGSNQNQAIHIERNRIFGNGSAECNGGITVNRGNPGTLIVNNLIYGNGRNGITFLDADGGPHYLVQNTIHANVWSGVSVARSHEVFLVNNSITGNGVATGSTGGRFGVTREASSSPQPATVHLLNNLVCGNRLGEIDGPALDGTDAGNLTPTGGEGPGISASPGCGSAANVYAHVVGVDGSAGTADDDFTLASTTAVGDGAHTLSGIATDRAGNNGTATRVVTVDNTPPDTQITIGPSGEIADTGATFTFTGTDNLTPTGSLVFAWRLNGAAFGAFASSTSANLSALAEGSHTFEVKARDLAGNEDQTPATRTFTVSLGPTITNVDPTSGAVGTLVTITGLRFSPGPVQVAFNGVPAVVRTATATSITTTVPIEATSGPVTVTTPQRTAASAQLFTVTTQPGLLRPDPARDRDGRARRLDDLHDLAVEYGERAVHRARHVVGERSAERRDGRVRPRRDDQRRRAPHAHADCGAVSADRPRDADRDRQCRGRGPDGHAWRSSRPHRRHRRTHRRARPDHVCGWDTDLDRALHPGRRDDHERRRRQLPAPRRAGRHADARHRRQRRAGRLADLRGRRDPRGRPRDPAGAVPHHPAAPARALRAPRQRHCGSGDHGSALPGGVDHDSRRGDHHRVGRDREEQDRARAPVAGCAAGAAAPRRDALALPGVLRHADGRAAVGTAAGDGAQRPEPRARRPGRDLVLRRRTPARRAGRLAAGRARHRQRRRQHGGLQPRRGAVAVLRGVWRVLHHPERDPAGAAQPTRSPRRRAGRPRHRLHGGGQDRSGAAGPNAGRGAAQLQSAGPVRAHRRVRAGHGPGVDAVDRRRAAGRIGERAPDDLAWQRPLRIRAPTGRELRQHDVSGLCRRRVDRGTLRFKDGHTWRFATAALPGLSLLVAQTDRAGNTLTIARDAFGRPTEVREPGGRTRTLTVEGLPFGGNRLTRVTDPLGRTVRYGYSGVSPFRLDTVTDANGGVTRYTYHATGGIVSITDPRGIVFITNEYDAQGRVIRQTQADGGVWNFAYSGPVHAHTSVTVTTPRGHPTVHRMDNAGFERETVNPLGQVTRRERDAVGRVTATTDPLGRVTRFGYDAVGNLTRITDPAGNVRTFTYEPTFNRVTSMTDPLNQVTRLEYDPAGNLTAAVNPLGQRTTFTYNAGGQPLTATDPLGNRTRFEYDTVGNLTATVDPLGNRTTREYDAASRLTRQLSALSRATAVSYDALNRTETILDALGGVTRFGYDGNGNLLTVTDPRGSVTTHTYDAMDRLAT